MSISYSGITNHGKFTLPSVEGGFGSMNILRDPPKSIQTRRIDKVGETSSITSLIDDSGNRACENILLYARGVNPMVSVSYGNEGRGFQSGSLTGNGLSIETGQAKLPYRIMNAGAFRPPVLLQEDLLPLSRLPRPWTSAYSQPGFADFSRKMRTCGTAEQTKEVHNQTLKACVRPTATYRIDTPKKEPFEIKYVIQPTLKKSAHSGMRTMDITQRHTGTPTKGIDVNPMHAFAQANYTDPHHYVNNSEFYTSPYLQDTNAHSVMSNISSKNHSTSIEDILDLSDLPVHDQIRTYSVDAPINGPEQTRYIHEEIELGRNLPNYQATTNLANPSVYMRQEYENQIELDRNIPVGSYASNPIARGFADHGSRDIRLAPKIQPGGYSVPGQIPAIDRTNQIPQFHESEKARTNRMVMESMQHRFNNLL